jgi:hypothetical protein
VSAIQNEYRINDLVNPFLSYPVNRRGFNLQVPPWVG